MKFKQKKKSPPADFNPESIKVTLKPILGIQPRLYVPAVWLILIILLVLLTLVMPGIRRNGTWLTVYSDPPDASVYVDGKRLGRSGKSIFVIKGIRNLKIIRPGFMPFIEERLFHGRVFASRLLPRSDEISVKLERDRNYQLLQTGIESFEAWSATGREKSRYAIPPVLTSLGRDLSAGAFDRRVVETVANVILPMARDERNLADINRLFYRLNSANTAPGPVSLVQYVVDALSFLEKNSLLEGIERIANQAVLSGGGNLTDDEKLRPKNVEVIARFYTDALASYEFQRSTAGGMTFVSIPALKAPIGDMELMSSGNYMLRFGAVPVYTDTQAFRIAVQEISNARFATFVKAVPKWSPDNRDALILTGLADDEYLIDWIDGKPDPKYSEFPVVGISWYAATAYAEWLTGQLFPNGSSKIRLPKEDEWEIAARLNGASKDTSDISNSLQSVSRANSGKIGLMGMMGNVREWCSNPFRYNEQQFQPPGYLEPGIDELYGSTRAVRGGAYIDSGPGLPFPASARGFLDAGTTSPVLGFRLIIEEGS